jgi:2-hydroxy-6-oxonona-2,4-dienedioate hydrolase
MENIKRLMNVFVFDPSQLTDSLLEGRLKNMQERSDHLQNFVRSTEANPRQFPDVGPRLGEISSPTLIVWGRDDRFVPLDTGLRLVAGLQDAELHVFSRCGHWAQWEHADKFNRMVVEFLGRRAAN